MLCSETHCHLDMKARLSHRCLQTNDLELGQAPSRENKSLLLLSLTWGFPMVLWNLHYVVRQTKEFPSNHPFLSPSGSGLYWLKWLPQTFAVPSSIFSHTAISSWTFNSALTSVTQRSWTNTCSTDMTNRFLLFSQFLSSSNES